MIKKQKFFQTMTAQQYRELMGISKPLSVQKENKYHAQKTEVDGIKFDSKKESKYWKNLCTMEAAGLISNLRRQVPFELQPKYVTRDGRKIRAITYIADFTYEMDGVLIVEDVKGGIATQTDVFKIKRKMLEYKYPDIEFRVV